MSEEEIDWATMFIHLRFDWRGRLVIRNRGGKYWKKGAVSRGESIRDPSLNKLIASGAMIVETSDGEKYVKDLDVAKIYEPNKKPERFIRYLRTHPPSRGYSPISIVYEPLSRGYKPPS